MPRLIVGLGNPKPAYKETRHNVGRDFIDYLRLKVKAKLSSDGPAEFFVLDTFSGHPLPNPVYFAYLHSYMNTSGPALKRFLDSKDIGPSETLVIVDDMMIPFGALRLRKSGSAGGHNGLKSLIEALSTEDFARLRVGVGEAKAGTDPADYVLSPFSDEELKKLPLIWKKSKPVWIRYLRAALTPP